MIGLNTLVLTDISVWKNSHVEDLMEKFDKFGTEEYATNNLLLCTNPLMAIALTSELLMRISERKQYRNQCNELKDGLLQLGQIFND